MRGERWLVAKPASFSTVAAPARYATSMKVDSIEQRRDRCGDASGTRVGVVN